MSGHNLVDISVCFSSTSRRRHRHRRPGIWLNLCDAWVASSTPPFAPGASLCEKSSPLETTRLSNDRVCYSTVALPTPTSPNTSHEEENWLIRSAKIPECGIKASDRLSPCCVNCGFQFLTSRKDIALLSFVWRKDLDDTSFPQANRWGMEHFRTSSLLVLVN